MTKNIIIIGLSLIILIGCVRQDCLYYPLGTYRAGQGPANFDGVCYRVIDNTKGSVNLENGCASKITTDRKLGADNSDMGDLFICGDAWVHDSIVRGEVCVGDGARIIETEVWGALSVDGDLTANQAVFHEPVNVNGTVFSNKSLFMEDLCVKAEMIILDCTKTQSIYLEHVGSYYHPQLICVRNGSVVEGDISFNSCCGKVFVDGTSTVCGKICGGHIIKPFECYEICK